MLLELRAVGRSTMGWLAAGCFIAAWFLPSASGLPGWKAFRYALAPVWPYGATDADAAEDALGQVLSALTNVVFLVMWVQWLTDRVRRPGLYVRVAILCFVLDLYWFVQMVRAGSWHDLWIGYYVWLAAFALLALIGVSQLRAARASGA